MSQADQTKDFQKTFCLVTRKLTPYQKRTFPTTFCLVNIKKSKLLIWSLIEKDKVLGCPKSDSEPSTPKTRQPTTNQPTSQPNNQPTKQTTGQSTNSCVYESEGGRHASAYTLALVALWYNQLPCIKTFCGSTESMQAYTR